MRSFVLINLAVFAIYSTAAPIANLPARVQTRTNDIKAENQADPALNNSKEATAGNSGIEQVSPLLKFTTTSDPTNNNTDAQGDRKAGPGLTDAELQCCKDVLKDVHTGTCTVNKCLEAIARARSTAVGSKGADASKDKSILNNGVVDKVASLVGAGGLVPMLGKTLKKRDGKVKRDSTIPKSAETVPSRNDILNIERIVNLHELLKAPLNDESSTKTVPVHFKPRRSRKREYPPARFEQLRSPFGTPFVDFIRHAHRCEKGLRVKIETAQQKPAQVASAADKYVTSSTASNAQKTSAPTARPIHVAVVKADTYNDDAKIAIAAANAYDNGAKVTVKAAPTPTPTPTPTAIRVENYTTLRPLRATTYSTLSPQVTAAAAAAETY
ncbi:hypothetical protein AA313_de0208588 [Arthrobotrys entomopaga]|nr:hypothetical protein AA313_de0208588 [Arthrobotrys entomopaga]